jgi:dUTP pyrophosphatase
MKRIKVRLIRYGIMPTYANDAAACFDVYLPEDIIISGSSHDTINLQVCFEVPNGYHLVLFPRSSTFTKHKLLVPTSIIDEDYRGPIHLQVYNMSSTDHKLKRGTRLIQGKLEKTIASYLVEVAELTPSNRGGLGSTGE